MKKIKLTDSQEYTPPTTFEEWVSIHGEPEYIGEHDMHLRCGRIWLYSITKRKVWQVVYTKKIKIRWNFLFKTA